MRSVIYFGALTTSIITTLRKFFTILFSVLIFGDEIDWTQKIGAGVVFIGIILDMTAKKNNKVKPQVNGSSEERDEIKMSLLSKGKWWLKLHLTPRGQKRTNLTPTIKTTIQKKKSYLLMMKTTLNMKYLT